jgi:hypothetical protein
MVKSRQLHDEASKLLNCCESVGPGDMPRRDMHGGVMHARKTHTSYLDIHASHGEKLLQTYNAQTAQVRLNSPKSHCIQCPTQFLERHSWANRSLSSTACVCRYVEYRCLLKTIVM